MFPDLRGYARRISPLAILALVTGLCLLSPAVTSAHAKTHAKAHLESGVSEESTTGPLQEPTTAPPTTNSSTESSTGAPPAESSTGTRGEERHAHRNAQALTGCSVSLEATPSTVTAGAPLSLTGTLSCPAASTMAGQTVTPGQTVTLYQKAAHTTGFSTAATAATETNGSFALALTGPAVNTVFYAVCDGVKSSRTSVEVAPQVTIEAPANGTQLLAGTAHPSSDTSADNVVGSSTGSSGSSSSAVTFTGTVSPAAPGATVTLQREYRPGAWHPIAHGLLEEEGKYTIVHTFLRPGQANIRVVVHSRGLYAASASAPVTYQISRPPRNGGE